MPSFKVLQNLLLSRVLVTFLQSQDRLISFLRFSQTAPGILNLLFTNFVKHNWSQICLILLYPQRSWSHFLPPSVISLSHILALFFFTIILLWKIICIYCRQLRKHFKVEWIKQKSSTRMEHSLPASTRIQSSKNSPCPQA